MPFYWSIFYKIIFTWNIFTWKDILLGHFHKKYRSTTEIQIHLDGILWIIAELKQVEKLKSLIAETNRHFLHANRYTPSKHIKMGGIIEGSKVKLKFIEHINYAHQAIVCTNVSANFLWW